MLHPQEIPLIRRDSNGDFSPTPAYNDLADELYAEMPEDWTQKFEAMRVQIERQMRTL